MKSIVTVLIAGIVGFAALVLDRVPLIPSIILGEAFVNERNMRTDAEGLWVIEAGEELALVTMRQGARSIEYREQAGFIRAAAACDPVSFVRAASACGPGGNLFPLEVTRIAGTLEVGPDAVYVIASEYYMPGRFQFPGIATPTALRRIAL